VSAAHLVFIPGVLLIGLVFGWVLGAKAANKKLSQARARARE
jgi:hypothetical protein